MRVFVTGATGFIGSAVVRDLLATGHSVIGLARSDAGAQALRDAGAEVLRGNIEDLDSLRSGAAGANGVVHTAFFHALSQMSLATRLRVCLGGLPGGIVGRYVGAAVRADRLAIEALGQALGGGGKPLVAAFATMAMKPGVLATEIDAIDPSAPGGPRGRNEAVIASLAGAGVRAMAVRLPPVVHDVGNHAGFPQRLLQLARKKRRSAYVGEGTNHWPSVHRLDAARAFRLALEKGIAGTRYHAVAEEGVPFRKLAELIATRAGVPAVSLKPADAVRHFGWLGLFTGTDNLASSRLTQQWLGWQPSEVGMLADLAQDGYFKD